MDALVQETSASSPAFQVVPEGAAGRTWLPRSPCLAWDVFW